LIASPKWSTIGLAIFLPVECLPQVSWNVLNLDVFLRGSRLYLARSRKNVFVLMGAELGALNVGVTPKARALGRR
jgi:hypothetical protein